MGINFYKINLPKYKALIFSKFECVLQLVIMLENNLIGKFFNHCNL